VRSQRRLALLILFCISVALAGCAPKKVRVYEYGGPPQKGDAIVQYAAGMLGRPYKSGAKGPDAFDCSGFVYYVYKRYEIKVPYTTEELVYKGYQISRENVVAGDLVIFTIKRSYHIGIMMNEREFVHASTSKGVAIGNLDLPYWRRSFSHFRRIL
jgi:cell wall-associated NlpC family hydrolase